MTAATTMTKGEREDLLRLVKQRERVMCAAARERSAVLLAEFEAQISAIHKFDTDDVWKKAVTEAEIAVKAAQEIVAARCAELGIPPDFAPDVQVSWYSRGQNAFAERRGELRRAAKAKIAASEQSATVQIGVDSITAQTQIMAHGLTSEAAKQFLSALPTVERLMPKLDARLIEGEVKRRYKHSELN